jgi:hypothetical protein
LIWDHNFIVNGNYALSDKFGVSFNAGATSRHDYDRQGVTSTDQGVFKFRHFNFSNQVSIQYSQVRNIVGAYGQAEFDYNKYLYLTVAARNDCF